MESPYETRLKSLRAELLRRKLDGFVVPRNDEHMSEYVGAYAQRLAWLTGFQGSAGSAVVLPAKAAIFVDGRYTLQVRQQVDARHWHYQSVPQSSDTAWLRAHVPQGARIGYDPWLHTKGWVEAARTATGERGAELVAVDSNPVDAVWSSRPALSQAPLSVYPDTVAGQRSAEKRKAIGDWLVNKKADAVVLSALDSIAWTFNVRGRDVKHIPVALAYALVSADGTADLFVAPEKVSNEVVRHLGNTVRLHPPAAFVEHLRSRANQTVAVDPARAVAGIFDALAAGGAHVIEARDPAVLPKAIKNASEVAGHRAAQARDGAALSRFLHWLSIEVPQRRIDETAASDKLQRFREATGELLDLSFDTISAAGPNGSVVHYRACRETNRPIEPGALYLVDSGGQYLDGTTDVTRTIAIGTPTAEMRERFTRVLKGHIAVASAVFPPGTRGSQLDILARQYLWAAGLDYAHGTGHGVGAYLAVHEGPQRIFNPALYPALLDEPLVPNMILSVEPGYYKSGEYGIRIENLILVIERDLAGAETKMLGFEMLTFAPIDRALIDVTMLTLEERRWIDVYHADVARIVGPQLDGAARVWLMEATRPLN